MLQINLFRSPLNTQSETIYIEATQKAIKDCLDIDFEYALIYVNGYQVDKDYILKEDDVCTIRQTHGLITSLVTGIQAAVNGRSFTDQWDSNKKDIQKKISDWLAEGNEEPDAPTNKNVDTTTQTIPQLAGAKNASAYGKYVPLVLGRSIYTSNYCGNQYRTISGTDGEKQTFHCLYLLGYKDIQVQDIKLGMTLLSSNPNLRDNGVFQNSEIDGRWDAETYNIQLELEQGSDVSIYPQKVSEEQLNIELLNTGTKKLELNRFSAKNPQTIEIEFTLNGLIGYSENGDEQEKSVQVQIKISFDGGTTYEPFGQIVGTGITYDSSTGVSTITRKKNKVMRFIATRTLTASEALSCENGVAELYIARNNAQAEGNNQFDKIYLSGIRTWCFDPKLSTSSALVAQKPVDSVRTSLTARLGISIEADEIEFKGQLEALNCILTAKGRTYSNGSWSSTLSPTTNPASMALLVLQHPSRGKYAYTDSQIDMDAFGEFYEWCNQPREQGDNTPKFQCNGVMTAKKKTKDYIDAILDCGRGSFLYNSRKISVWIDKPRDTPVMVLNNQNILSQQNNKTLDDLPDGYKCKFVNEITWQTDEWDIIINPNAGANPVYESIDLIFQTNPKQIYQNMMYLYAKNKLRPETWKPRVSVDGNLLDIGSLIEIQNDTLSVGIGDGAEIKELVTDNGYITQIKTDGNMYIDDLTQEYGIKVTCADGVHEPKVMTYKVVPSATGEQSVFTFDTPILESATYKPNVGDIISFGFLDRITTQALCFGKKDNGDGTFDLTLVPYQEGVYTADSGEIPEFKTNVSDIPQRDRGTYEPDKTAERFAEVNQKIDEIETGTADIGEPDDITGLSAVAKQDRISISWNPLGNGLQNTIKRYYVEIKKGNGNWQSLPSTTANTTEYIFNRNTDGYPEYSVLDTWKVRVKAENIYGVLAEDWTVAGVNTNSYGTWIPATPSFVEKIPNQGGITFKWNAPATGVQNRTLYGNNRFELKVYYNDVLRSTINTSELFATYNFVRQLDGYPEPTAGGGIEGLDLYTFDLKVFNESTNGNATLSDVTLSSAEIANYGTWTPYINATFVATKHAERDGIEIEWKMATGNTRELYGGVTYTVDIKYNGSSRASLNSDALRVYYAFDRSVDKYPELHENVETGDTDLSLYTIRITAESTVTHRTSTTSSVTLDTTGYKTWKIPNISVQSEVIDRTAILTAIYSSDNIYGTPMLLARIKRRGNLDVVNGKTFNQYLGITEDSQYYEPNFDDSPQPSSSTNTELNYRKNTQNQFRSISNKITHTLPLLGQNYRLFDSEDTYIGKFSFEATTVILITEVTEEPSSMSIGEMIHYTGTTTSDFENGKYYIYGEEGWSEVVSDDVIHYTGETNEDWTEDKYYQYSTTWSELVSKTVFVPTIYKYELQLTNESGNLSNTVEQEITVLCTNIADIVHSHEHYKDLYVEKLSAISANIGMISQGGMGSFAELMNYWALSDLSADDTGVAGGVKKGAFRVGGQDQYFKVTPLGNNQYDIELKAGNITLTSSGDGTTFKQGTYIYDANDANKRLALTPTGIIAQQKVNNLWDNIAQVIIDSKGNLVISNDTQTVKYGFKVTGADIYHFETNTLDENAQNPQSLVFNGSLEEIDETTYPLLPIEQSGKCFSGKIKKDISNFTGNIVLFSRNSCVLVGDLAINADNGVNVITDAHNLNELMKTQIPNRSITYGSNLGLSTAQINKGMFRLVNPDSVPITPTI